jgi:hypothetical protein
LRVLVVGGSLGAQALNQNLPLAVAQLASTERPVIRHQTGPRDLVSVQAAYAAIDAKSVDYSYWVYQMSKIFQSYPDTFFVIHNKIDWQLPSQWQQNNVKFQALSL